MSAILIQILKMIKEKLFMISIWKNHNGKIIKKRRSVIEFYIFRRKNENMFDENMLEGFYFSAIFYKRNSQKTEILLLHV